MEPEKIKRYVYKNQSIFDMVNTVKLWPSRSGILHGVKQVVHKGKMIEITTHCGETFVVWDSKNSRSIRWLRNRWFRKPCPHCKVPEWKLQKYSSTVFTGDARKL
ncbi:MAG: pyrrolysine--tRNA(Pyl) ligase small subunit [Oscillospiraceae bacterium]|nr:pyrrolysine--tRNA(Pyl) ligase small subunit [Oscillospiraceae bacterium]